MVRTLNVGEPNELHWDRSGRPGTGTVLYYRNGAQLRRLDVLSGEDTLVHDFTAEYPSAQLQLYRARLCDGWWRVLEGP